jgi:uncharacterized protein (TIGR03083 family)
MDRQLDALTRSAERLRDLVTPLGDQALERQAYPTEWRIADVLSHIGSGAVISLRRLEDGIKSQPMPDDFAPTVWETWNAKSPRAKADDALMADRELVERLHSLTPDEARDMRFSLGPMTFDITGFVGLRLNEHAMHTWDIEVAIDPSATIPGEAVELLVDNLELVGRFTARPTGTTRRISVRTSEPERGFAVELTPDEARLKPTDPERDADLAVSSEVFARLVYGRLERLPAPSFTGDSGVLDQLRAVFPGP